MHLLPVLLLLHLAAFRPSSTATLKQYGRDWLIGDLGATNPDETKRISAKSVFIAPSFSTERCAEGYREDPTGRCVKLVRVSQSGQLDFLLERLNAMYGAAATAPPTPAIEFHEAVVSVETSTETTTSEASALVTADSEAMTSGNESTMMLSTSVEVEAKRSPADGSTRRPSTTESMSQAAFAPQVFLVSSEEGKYQPADFPTLLGIVPDDEMLTDTAVFPERFSLVDPSNLVKEEPLSVDSVQAMDVAFASNANQTDEVNQTDRVWPTALEASLTSNHTDQAWPTTSEASLTPNHTDRVWPTTSEASLTPNHTDQAWPKTSEASLTPNQTDRVWPTTSEASPTPNQTDRAWPKTSEASPTPNQTDRAWPKTSEASPTPNQTDRAWPKTSEASPTPNQTDRAGPTTPVETTTSPTVFDVDLTPSQANNYNPSKLVPPLMVNRPPSLNNPPFESKPFESGPYEVGPRPAWVQPGSYNPYTSEISVNRPHRTDTAGYLPYEVNPGNYKIYEPSEWNYRHKGYVRFPTDGNNAVRFPFHGQLKHRTWSNNNNNRRFQPSERFSNKMPLVYERPTKFH